MGSGGKIRYFFEEDAFAEDSSLRGSFHESINKVGHGSSRRGAWLLATPALSPLF